MDVSFLSFCDALPYSSKIMSVISQKYVETCIYIEMEIAKLSSIAESQTGSIGILTDQFKQDLFQKNFYRVI